MICIGHENGTIRPLKFKICAPDGSHKVYEVLQIYTSDLSTIAGIQVYRFNCEIAINALSKLCEIRYDLDACRWVLFKI